jgi:hypothetical protein
MQIAPAIRKLFGKPDLHEIIEESKKAGRVTINLMDVEGGTEIKISAGPGYSTPPYLSDQLKGALQTVVSNYRAEGFKVISEGPRHVKLQYDGSRK